MLPLSTKHDSIIITTMKASPMTLWDSTQYDPNVKWRHLESWQSPEEILSHQQPHDHQDENIPIFDPFNLGPKSTDAVGEFDRKIDVYLEKAAINENRKRGNDPSVLSSPALTTMRTPTRRPPLRETSPPQVAIQSTPPLQASLAVSTGKSSSTNQGKSPLPLSHSSPLVRNERIRNGKFSPSGSNQSPPKSCMSPDKSPGCRFSVSFDLSRSQKQLRRVHEERKQRRNRAFENKVYVSKRNRPNGSIENNDTNTGHISNDHCSISTNSLSTEEDFFEKLVTKASSSSSTSSDGDFFDQLVTRSSSSSHGATEWFESLLEDTKTATVAAAAAAAAAAAPAEILTSSNGMKGTQRVHGDRTMWADPFGSPATITNEIPSPPLSRPKLMKTRDSINPKDHSIFMNETQVSQQINFGNVVQRESRAVQPDKSWLQQAEEIDLQDEMITQVSSSNTKIDLIPDQLLVPKSSVIGGENKAAGFTLETVASRSGSDSTRSEKADESNSIEHRSFTPKGSIQDTRQSSPSWRSRGSRTDQLLRNIGLEINTKRKGGYDSFGMRRDPEARRYDNGKDPDGILGNQLASSSSSSSSSTTNESRSTYSGSSGTEDMSVSGNPLKNVSAEGYIASVSQTKEVKPGASHGKSLLDYDLSRSSSASTKFSDDTGPNLDKTQTKPPGMNSINRKAADDRSQRLSDIQKSMTEPEIPLQKSDDDSSVFSNLPSVSIAQSNHAQNSVYDCLAEDVTNEALLGNAQSIAGDCTTLATGIESELAILEGVVSNTATEKREINNPDVNPRNTSNLPCDGRKSDPCVEKTAKKKQATVEIAPCSPATCDSHDQLRTFWKHLADVKTHGSFDSDSLVKESSGWQSQTQSCQPFIDRYPTGESEPIKARRSPQSEKLIRRSVEAPNPTGGTEPITTRRSPQSEKLFRRSVEGPIRGKSFGISSEELKDTRMRRRRPSNEVPRQSNARYLTGAQVLRGSPDDSRKPVLHQSSIWMTSIPDPTTPQVENREMPEPVEKSVLYIVGPLMSADTEEDTALTDDFTRQDDHASVVAQQSCYSCLGLGHSGWTWF